VQNKKARSEVIKIGTDWFVKVKCPRPNKSGYECEEHVSKCSGCPYAIWNEPEPVSGFMASMCGVRVGSIGMAADLDNIGEELSGIENFTEKLSNPALILEILEQIKSRVEKDDWKFERISKTETLNHLNMLIDFCRRTKAKNLDIRVWA